MGISLEAPLRGEKYPNFVDIEPAPGPDVDR
jgi:hypothetical protein